MLTPVLSSSLPSIYPSKHWPCWEIGGLECELSMVSSTTLVRAEARESEPTGAPAAGLKPLTFHTHPLLQFRLKTSQEVRFTLGRLQQAIAAHLLRSWRAWCLSSSSTFPPGTFTYLNLSFSICKRGLPEYPLHSWLFSGFLSVFNEMECT